MRISEAERQAIVQVVAAGQRFGYGNLISHLATAWARHLMETQGFPEDVARRAAYGIDGYPIQMHRDLLERGEWDETGARYRAPGLVLCDCDLEGRVLNFIALRKHGLTYRLLGQLAGLSAERVRELVIRQLSRGKA